MTNSRSTVIIILCVLTAALAFFAYMKRSNKVSSIMFKPLVESWGGVITVALLFSLSVSLNLGTSDNSGIPVTIFGVVLMLILFYTVLVPNSSVSSKILLFIFVLICVFAWIMDNTKPHSVVVLSCILVLFFVIYAVTFRHSIDPMFRAAMGKLTKNSWVVFFLLVGAFISEIILITGMYEKGHDISGTDTRILGWIILITLILFTGLSYAPFAKKIFSRV
jgi:amino acid transporter